MLLDKKQDWTIVPAAAGHKALVLWTYRNDWGRPETLDDVIVDEYAILAWKVHHEEPPWAEPVFIVRMEGLLVYIVQPNGSLRYSGNTVVELDEAKQQALYSGQISWDRYQEDKKRGRPEQNAR